MKTTGFFRLGLFILLSLIQQSPALSSHNEQFALYNDLDTTKILKNAPELSWHEIGHYFTYFPSTETYFQPSEKIQFRDFMFPSLDKTPLHGRILYHNPEVEYAGTIVFFHGNAGNLSGHFMQVAWLTLTGWDVFIFDYRGFGKSYGKPGPRGFYLDSIAALEYTRKVLSPGNFIVVSHSLGGIISARAIVDYAHKESIDLLVMMGTFSSYNERGKDAVGTTLSSFALSHDFNFDDKLDALSSIPLLLIHGKKDQINLFRHSQELYNQFPGKKWLWAPEEAGHMNIFFHEIGFRQFYNINNQKNFPPLMKKFDQFLKQSR